MNQEIEDTDSEQPPVTAVIGTVIMFAGGMLLFVMTKLVDNLGGVEQPPRDFTLPPMFYANRPMWYALAGVLILAGVLMQRSKHGPNAAGKPVFRSVVVFSRKDCHLCDDAKVLLLKWSKDLPTILDVDVDDDPELLEQFGDCVPVVEIDGKVRFRGKVSEVLFLRLLDAAKRRGPQIYQPDVPASDSQDEAAG
ncbi:MAG: glutaredoxin family protein [Planctomycetota bacterium]|nr:glutaredoxin family protein [Planctomycetota bacterium]